MRLQKNCLVLLTTMLSFLGFSQEGIPIYSDYLTDNYYLLHPSMAGVREHMQLMRIIYYFLVVNLI